MNTNHSVDCYCAIAVISTVPNRSQLFVLLFNCVLRCSNDRLLGLIDMSIVITDIKDDLYDYV